VRLAYVIVGLLLLTLVRSESAAPLTKEIPFEFRDGLIWVQATMANSPGPLNLILDSGAQVSVINQITAKRLAIKGGRRVTVEGVGSTTTGFWPQRVDISAGSLPLPRNYLMLDLQKLSAVCTNGIVDGIIGADFFQDRIVEIDFEVRRLRVLENAPPSAGSEVLPLKIRRCGMLVPIQVNQAASQWVRLDTGCASALHWVSSNVRLNGCNQRIAVALTNIRIPVTETTVRIGNTRFGQVPTDLHSKAIFPGEKGLLGNGLLSRFKSVVVDSKNGKLHLR
jgi:hypothetical protein